MSENLPVPEQGQEDEVLKPEASQVFPTSDQDDETETETSQNLPISDQSEEALEMEDESDREPDFISNSLKYDIKTSRKEELVAWCRVLNLPDDGTVDQLKSRLHEYYAIKDFENSDDVSSESGNQVVIESAKRSEYFEVSIAGGEKEPVVKLSGDVVLTVNETKRNRKHEVKADSILFNEGSNTISAVGNIEYIVDTNGREERFTGDSLTFDVNDWTGIIFHGTSERKEEIDKKEVPFFFRGDSIKRASANIMVLYNGSISSTDTDNPDYALKANKIWITGPGEWSIFSATIHVGHLPLLYLPFYWKSGRDLFFNPVIGQRTDKGYYIQTTSYLIGQKEEDDGFSMLGFGDSAGGEYALVREGLYLVKKPVDAEKKSANSTAKKTNRNTLKYTLDAYTGLGAATGLTGSFPKLGDNGKLNFYLSVGVSRSIDADGNVYFRDGTTPKIYWNSTQLGTATLPFRWGSLVDFSYKKWKLLLNWYSDPYYNQDFGDRQENFDWLRLLLSEEDETEKADSISTLKWELAGSHSFNLKKLSPWLSGINISHLKMSLSWKNKSNASITESTNPDKSVNPARSFYYPNKLILPDLKIVVRGALPSYTVKRKKKEITEETSSSPPDQEEVSDDDTLSMNRPNIVGDFSGIYNSKLFEASLKYDLDSRFYMEDTLLDSDWDDPSDINFHDFKGTKINTIQQGNIHYGLKFWDGLIGFSGSTKLSGHYQVHESFFGTEVTIADTTKLEDYKYTKFNWENILSLRTYPLQGIPSLSASEVRYSIDANILNYSFKEGATVDNPQYMLNWIEDKEDLKKHEATASFKFKRSPVSFSTDFTSNVPPLDVKYAVKFATGVDYRGFKVGINQNNTFENEEWKHDPINMTASWKGWKDEVEVAQTAQFDVEKDRFSKIDSILKFWGAKARFVATHTKTYDWSKQSNSWVEGEEAFVPSLLEFSFNRTFAPKPSWKNRIKIKTIIDTSWKISLIKPTDNVLRFKWTQQLDIHKFLSLKITFSAINRSMYLYFPELRDKFGITTGSNNFFEDLLKSFNIFNDKDRIESQFNMEKISVGMVHYLRNWDLSLEYSGWPKLNNDTKNYDWNSEFSIFIKWNPLPLFNQRTSLKDDVWSVESFGDNIDFE